MDPQIFAVNILICVKFKAILNTAKLLTWCREQLLAKIGGHLGK